MNKFEKNRQKVMGEIKEVLAKYQINRFVLVMEDKQQNIGVVGTINDFTPIKKYSDLIVKFYNNDK